jgi:hypothetical protein
MSHPGMAANGAYRPSSTLGPSIRGSRGLWPDSRIYLRGWLHCTHECRSGSAPDT